MIHRKLPLLLSATLLAFLALPSFADDAAPKTDQDFVMKAAQGGIAEVEGGKLAKTNGAAAGVKEFGEMMIQDHSKANAELEMAAMTAKLTFPAETDAEHRQMLDKLAAKKGGDFDKAYVDDMIAGHKKMEKLLDAMSKQATSAQLKDWAKKTLPAVQSHLRKAEELKASLR